MKDFHYNDLTRSLGSATPTTSSLKNSWTRKSLTCSLKNNTCEPASSPRPQPPTYPITMAGTLGDLFSLSPTNTLTNKDAYRMDIELDGSSLCE